VNSVSRQTSSRAILSVSVRDIPVLYASYMPFLQNGGIFIPTDSNYQMGDEVFLLLSLQKESDKIPVNGKVAWVTPLNAQGGKVPGVGVQFTENNSEAKLKIEELLSPMIRSEKSTHTL
jgi:type IV pilus assembly protein PilZ